MKRTVKPLSALALLAALLGYAAAQSPRPPLIPCQDASGPCVVLATQPQDIVGIWKHYVSRPDLNAPGGMGYQRINADGSFVMADTPENTAAPYAKYPYGTYAFENGVVVLTVATPGTPPACQTARQQFYIYRDGAQPVALIILPVEDDCPPRLQDTRLPFVWVAPASE